MAEHNKKGVEGEQIVQKYLSNLGYKILETNWRFQKAEVDIIAKNNDLVTIPKGYHPVVAGHGYNVYYLNFLAGTDQSLANSDDPDHKWIYKSWKGKDPRVPMVTAN